MIYRLDHPREYLYKQMADHIARRIASGELTANARLPNEQALAEDYGVSLGTARHATRNLRERGLLVTIRCKGTFVNVPEENGPIRV